MSEEDAFEFTWSEYANSLGGGDGTIAWMVEVIKRQRVEIARFQDGEFRDEEIELSLAEGGELLG